jgi:small subunit ribosomal protein S21
MERRNERDPRHEPVRAKHVEVGPRNGESPDRMIKRFMKKVRGEGILQELYQRKAFEKPSVKRRRKRAKADFNRRLALREVETKN